MRTLATPSSSAVRHADSLATMPAVAVPLAITCVDAGRVEHRDRFAAIVEHARRAAGDHEVACAERGRNAARHHVGVHVQNRRDQPAEPRFRDAETRDDRHVAVHEQQLDQRRIRVGRIAHQRRDRRRRPRSSDARRARRAAESGIDAGQADGRHAARDQRRHELGVRRAGQHGHDHVERRAIRDAQAVDFLRRDRAAIEFRVDRAAAAVHRHERPMRRRSAEASAAIRARSAGESQQFAAQLQNQRSAHSSPVRSSMPNATLKFCSAWPAAPFTRLSMHDTITSRRDAGVEAPADVAEIRVRHVLDLRQRIARQPDERFGRIGLLERVAQSARPSCRAAAFT